MPWNDAVVPDTIPLIDTVFAVTASWKVRPPALAMSTVAVPVTAPVKVTAPEVSTTAVPAPDRPAAVTAPLPPLPRFSVLPARVKVPTVMAPEPAPRVVLAVAEKAPRVRGASWVVIVPPVETDGAVAVRPPEKASVSPPSPKVSAPVLLKIVGPETVVEAPVRAIP